MTGWDLPTTVSVKETSYRIHADYRDILGVLEQLNDPENAGAIGIYVALNLFYEDFQKLSPADYRRGLPSSASTGSRTGTSSSPTSTGWPVWRSGGFGSATGGRSLHGSGPWAKGSFPQ